MWGGVGVLARLFGRRLFFVLRLFLAEGYFGRRLFFFVTGIVFGALARARIYVQFDTNSHFFPIFRLSLQPNPSTKVNEILFAVSSMTDDYLYKF